MHELSPVKLFWYVFMFALAVLATYVTAARAESTAFISGSIVLLQPDAQMSERLSGDVDTFAAYIQEILAISAALVEAHPEGKATTGVVVVALRPGRRSRVWLEFGKNEVPMQLTSELSSRIESIPPPMVWGGPVSFLINVDLWGGSEPLTDAKSPIFAPAEWRDAIRRAGRSLDTDSILNVVWPEEGS